jgi:hypothetical protein
VSSITLARFILDLEESAEGVCSRSIPKHNGDCGLRGPAEPNSEDEVDSLRHPFEGGNPTDTIDDNEDQEDSNLGSYLPEWYPC